MFFVLLINAGVVGYIHNYCNNITKFVKFTVGKYKKMDSNNIAFVHFLYLSAIIFRLFAGIYFFGYSKSCGINSTNFVILLHCGYINNTCIYQ